MGLVFETHFILPTHKDNKMKTLKEIFEAKIGISTGATMTESQAAHDNTEAFFDEMQNIGDLDFEVQDSEFEMGEAYCVSDDLDDTYRVIVSGSGLDGKAKALIKRVQVISYTGKSKTNKKFEFNLSFDFNDKESITAAASRVFSQISSTLV